MGRKQTKFPAWWTDLKMPARLRDRLRAMFSVTRDGYTIWYKGSPRFVGKGVAPADVEGEWGKRRDAIDRAEREAIPYEDRMRLYREVLAEFLGVQKARIGAPKRPLAERTYHNYVVALNAFGNFAVDDRKVADTPIRDVGPRHFSAYGATFRHLKASAFDSVVVRVAALFGWAVEMEYIERYRPGPDFRRPAKAELRDDRIQAAFALTTAQVAAAYEAANGTLRCWVGLGVCAGFVNSDVAHLTRAVVDLDTGVIDFRRRKTGKVRRVIPLPAELVDLLKSYERPEPAEGVDADLFFLTENGRPYGQSRNANGKPSNTASVLMARLLKATGAKGTKDGRGMKSFRTTFYNLAPRSGFDLERKIVMGRAQGTVDLDSYLEDVGLDRLRHVVNHVWDQVTAERAKVSSTRPGSAETTEGGGAVDGGG